MRKLEHDEIPRTKPEALKKKKRHPVVLVLDDIRSAHNVGAAFRSSDGFLIQEVIISGFTPSPEVKAVHKAALGSQDFVPWKRVEDVFEYVKHLKSEGYLIAALEITDSPTLPCDLEMEHFPVCVIAGNEVYGVSDKLLSICDIALEIPQYGAKQSLNVSVAVGITLFDLVRRYRTFM